MPNNQNPDCSLHSTAHQIALHEKNMTKTQNPNGSLHSAAHRICLHGRNIQKNKKDIIIFKGKFRGKINLNKNSVIDTLKILRKIKILKNFYKITVKKKHSCLRRFRRWNK